MAEKKTKTTTSTTKKSTSPARKPAARKKPSDAERAVAQMDQGEALLSPRAIAALVSLFLFILFTIIAIWRDGMLTAAFYSFLLGLIGKAAFYISIPSLLGLFLVLVSSQDRPVIMRSVCLILFPLTVGCISQLMLPSNTLPSGFGVIGALYQGGTNDTAAGVICGGLSLILHKLTGTVLSYIILIITAALLLMASLDLTIPKLIIAFRNRPRPEAESEPVVHREPAEVVVNSIANKQMEWTQRRRERAEAAQTESEHTEEVRQKARRHAWTEAFMRNIDSDPGEPVAAAHCVEPPVTEKKESGTPAEAPAYQEMPQQPSDRFQWPDTEEPAPAAQEPVVSRKPEQVQQPVKHQEPEKPQQPVKPQPEEPREAVRAEQKKQDPQPRSQDQQKPASAPRPAEQKSDPPAAAAAAAQMAAAGQQKVSAKEAAQSAAEVAQEIAQAEAQAEEKPEYCYPPIDLLHLPAGGKNSGTDEMRENSRRLNETLASFKIEAHIINVTRGPSVTRYEVELDRGVRLNKLTTSADDIALNLGASGVRIAAIPGKISVVGIEVPNKSVTTVSLREVIDSPEFTKAKSKSSFAVGKDIGGNCIVGNIAKLPHMLIAGTTGSGKSVCMNSIIISLLYKASPEDVKLIMVDPKMVELGIYNGIPHLLIPVVTDPKKAAGSLQWAVTEMMRRYKAMSDAGVRDLESYNAIVESQEAEGKHLPQVVVIIDELADLMLVAAKEVEESICRIAQMGRAAGIHLIIATQRPSADVITGLMKANIPSRIAFAVASAMESRIILDTQGAEKLVGKGDMLYAPIGCGKPKRVQGSWVSENEVEAVTAYIKQNYQTEYDEKVMEEIDKKAEQTGNKGASSNESQSAAEEVDGDEMLPAAVDVIMETGQASVSMLQRRLKLGYARAARIVDEMEDKGIVGPFMGSKPRSILITKEQWQIMKNGGEEPQPEPVPEEPEEDQTDLFPPDEDAE